jgi:hypothetical protein
MALGIPLGRQDVAMGYQRMRHQAMGHQVLSMGHKRVALGHQWDPMGQQGKRHHVMVHKRMRHQVLVMGRQGVVHQGMGMRQGLWLWLGRV